MPLTERALNSTAVNVDRGWKRPFDDPIPSPRGRHLVTLEDAGNHITRLPKAEHEALEWQAAMEALILVAALERPDDVRVHRRNACTQSPRQAGNRVEIPADLREEMSADIRKRLYPPWEGFGPKFN
jgi:hypothetical protein